MKVPILERFRRKQSGSPGPRLLLVLGALLLAVLIAMTSLSGTGERGSTIQPKTQTPPADPTLKTDVDSSIDSAIEAYVWQELGGEDERRMLAALEEQGPLFLREHREAYYYMLNKVHRMSEADLEYLLDPKVTYEDFATRPSIIRGAAVNLRGTLIRFKRTDLGHGRSGLASIWQGNLVDPEGRPILVALTESPEPPLVVSEVGLQKQTPEVTVRGIFIQNVQYENMAGDTIAAPLIIARELRVANKVARPGKDGSSGIWIALACATALLLVWRLWRTYREIRTRPARRVRADLPEDLK
jgi:hypothetical protein